MAKRGPKSLHRGNWSKGQSGNPGGRPRKSERVRTFEEACRAHVVELLPQMVEAVEDQAVPVRERTQVFELLCAYALGKPIDRLAVQAMGDNVATPKAVAKDVLEQQVAQLLDRADITAEYAEVSGV
ncbi:MAG: DUF5681 domain-containing protein [Halioglobus sp.]